MGYNSYENTNTRLDKKRLLDFIDNSIKECENSLIEYQNAINGIESYLQEQKELANKISELEHKYNWRLKQYIDKKTYNF